MANENQGYDVGNVVPYNVFKDGTKVMNGPKNGSTPPPPQTSSQLAYAAFIINV